MGLSAVTSRVVVTPVQAAAAPAGAGAPAAGLSEQDQVALLAASPAALQSAAIAAAHLVTPGADPGSTGSAVSRGSVDTYL